MTKRLDRRTDEGPRFHAVLRFLRRHHNLSLRKSTWLFLPIESRAATHTHTHQYKHKHYHQKILQETFSQPLLCT
jgi:hypothetical protein